MSGNASNQASKVKTKNWVEINDDSRGPYNTNKQIEFKTTMWLYGLVYVVTVMHKYLLKEQ